MASDICARFLLEGAFFLNTGKSFRYFSVEKLFINEDG
jgi:hypothetical protein